MSDNFSLIFDGLIVILLVVTIVYAIILNRKLGALRDAKEDMAALVARFADSADKAGSGLASLKDHAAHSEQDLQGKFEAARALADDLSFLVERGNGLADRLEGAIGVARVKDAAQEKSAAGSSPRSQAGSKPAIHSIESTGPVKATGPVKTTGESQAAEPTTHELSPQEAELLKALQGMR